MKGDPGPYMETDGHGIWVPRTVPYLRAREIAKSGMDYGDRLVYVGKEDAALLGFARDCDCDETCELADRCRVCHYSEWECECETPDPEDHDICHVPAWHFEQVER